METKVKTNKMNYIDERNGEVKKTSYLRLVNGDSQYRVELGVENDLIITKVDFDNNELIIKPKVRNQISIK